MDIISKFTIGSDEGVADLLTVETSAINHLYTGKVSEENIKTHIEKLDPTKMVHELNDLSTQLIITYADGQPVAYSIIKSGSVYPGFSEDKRITELKFAVVQEQDSPEIRSSLLKKTKSAISFTDIVWINVMVNDPLLEFFKESGFTIAENTQSDAFSLPSYLLTMEFKK
jgi:hypothetical protein